MRVRLDLTKTPLSSSVGAHTTPTSPIKLNFELLPYQINNHFVELLTHCTPRHSTIGDDIVKQAMVTLMLSIIEK